MVWPPKGLEIQRNRESPGDRQDREDLQEVDEVIVL